MSCGRSQTPTLRPTIRKGNSVRRLVAMWIVCILFALVAVDLILSLIPAESFARAYASKSAKRPGRQPEARVLPPGIEEGNG